MKYSAGDVIRYFSDYGEDIAAIVCVVEQLGYREDATLYELSNGCEVWGSDIIGLENVEEFAY